MSSSQAFRSREEEDAQQRSIKKIKDGHTSDPSSPTPLAHLNTSYKGKLIGQLVEDEAQAAQSKGSGSTANAPFEVITVVVISNVHHFIKAADDAHCFIKGISDAHRFGYVTGVSSSCVKRCRLGLFKCSLLWHEEQLWLSWAFREFRRIVWI